MLDIGGMATVKSVEESVRPTSWVAIFTILSTQVWSTR